jgi:hypothetical protein
MHSPEQGDPLLDLPLLRQRMKRFRGPESLAHPVMLRMDARMSEQLEDLAVFPRHILVFGSPFWTTLPHTLPTTSVVRTLADIGTEPRPDLQGWAHAVVIPGQMHILPQPAVFLRTMHSVLAPGGVLMGSGLAEGSLYEPGYALMAADIRHFNGASPRIHPLRGLQEWGHLLSSSGFGTLTLDQDRMQLEAPSFMALLQDIRKAGGGNCLKSRSRVPLTRAFWRSVEDAWPDRGTQGACAPWSASLNMVSMIAWREA